MTSRRNEYTATPLYTTSLDHDAFLCNEVSTTSPSLDQTAPRRSGSFGKKSLRSVLGKAMPVRRSSTGKQRGGLLAAGSLVDVGDYDVPLVLSPTLEGGASSSSCTSTSCGSHAPQLHPARRSPPERLPSTASQPSTAARPSVGQSSSAFEHLMLIRNASVSATAATDVEPIAVATPPVAAIPPPVALPPTTLPAEGIAPERRFSGARAPRSIEGGTSRGATPAAAECPSSVDRRFSGARAPRSLTTSSLTTTSTVPTTVPTTVPATVPATVPTAAAAPASSMGALPPSAPSADETADALAASIAALFEMGFEDALVRTALADSDGDPAAAFERVLTLNARVSSLPPSPEAAATHTHAAAGAPAAADGGGVDLSAGEVGVAGAAHASQASIPIATAAPRGSCNRSADARPPLAEPISPSSVPAPMPAPIAQPVTPGTATTHSGALPIAQPLASPIAAAASLPVATATPLSPSGAHLPSAAPSPPSLVSLISFFERELGLSGPMLQVVDGACAMLEVRARGSAIHRAVLCWQALGAPPLAEVPAASAAAVCNTASMPCPVVAQPVDAQVITATAVATAAAAQPVESGAGAAGPAGPPRSGAGGRRPAGPNAQPWACSVCTFEHASASNMSFLTCELCGSPRPD